MAAKHNMGVSLGVKCYHSSRAINTTVAIKAAVHICEAGAKFPNGLEWACHIPWDEVK